ELFLAQKIKQMVPDVQLFFMDSELLFAHTELASQMRGALVVARYPLFNLNQLWTPPRQMFQRVQFVSGSSQGVYNAAIMQLRDLARERNAKPARVAPSPSAVTPVSAVRGWLGEAQSDAEGETRSVSGTDEGSTLKPPEYGEPFKPKSSRPPLWV